MARLTGILLLAGIKFMPPVKIIRLVIQRRPVVRMTLSAVDETFHFRRVDLGYALGIRAGIQDSPQDKRNQYDV
jgi:hypothetical protein